MKSNLEDGYSNSFGEGITVKKGTEEITTGDEVAYGTELTVTADPKTGHTSVLSASVGTIAEDGTYTVEGAVTFSVEYTAETYAITIADGITVKDGETKIASGTLVAYDTVLTVTADPKTGYTSVVLANGDDVVDETYTVVGDVKFTVQYTINIDELEDIIDEEDKPKVEMSKDAAEEEISNDKFRKLANDKKTLVIDVVDNGVTAYSWTFEGDYDETKDGTFKASIVAEEPEGDLKDAIDSAKVKNSLVLNFSAKGTLPMKATVKYYVGDKFDEGATLTLFFYNADEKALEETESNLTVDKDGYVSFSPPHFSQYVLAESEEDDEAGSNALLYAGIVIAIVVIALIAVFAIRRQ